MTKFNSQIVDLRKTIFGLEEENEKLRNTMREMVDDYTKQLEFRDENIRQLENSRPQEAVLRRELDDYMHENRVLKEKNASLNRDLDQYNSQNNLKSQYLKDENARLT